MIIRKAVVGIMALTLSAMTVTGCSNTKTEDDTIQNAMVASVGAEGTSAEWAQAEESSTAKVAVEEESIEDKEIKEKLDILFTEKDALDPKKYYDVCDFEVMYYINKSIPPQTKDRVLRYFASDDANKKLDTLGLTQDDITYEIINISSLEEMGGSTATSFLQVTDERELNSFLINTYGKSRLEMTDEDLISDTRFVPVNTETGEDGVTIVKDNLARKTDNSFFKPYSEIKEATGITDARLAIVRIKTKEGCNKGVVLNLSVPVYVFKIDSVWKVDPVLTMEHLKFTTYGTIENLFEKEASEEEPEVFTEEEEEKE